MKLKRFGYKWIKSRLNQTRAKYKNAFSQGLFYHLAQIVPYLPSSFLKGVTTTFDKKQSLWVTNHFLKFNWSMRAIKSHSPPTYSTVCRDRKRAEKELLLLSRLIAHRFGFDHFVDPKIIASFSFWNFAIFVHSVLIMSVTIVSFNRMPDELRARGFPDSYWDQIRTSFIVRNYF